MTAEPNSDAALQTSEVHGLPIIYAPRGFKSASSVHTREPKAAEITASRIVDNMVNDRLGVGDKLPTEPEMLERYAVSRESLREALRLLEIQGIIDIKRGPGGGPFVAPLNSGYLARTSSLYFYLSGATHAELFDTWRILESSLAELVAQLPDRRTKRELFAPFIDYDPRAHQSEELFDDFNNFHAVIATLSGNRVLTLVTQSVTHVVVENVLNSVDPISEASMLTHSHEDIALAIVDSRPAKARKLMTDHILEVTETFVARSPERLHAPVEWRL